jgi:hypothetical protein
MRTPGSPQWYRRALTRVPVWWPTEMCTGIPAGCRCTRAMGWAKRHQPYAPCMQLAQGSSLNQRVTSGVETFHAGGFRERSQEGPTHDNGAASQADTVPCSNACIPASHSEVLTLFTTMRWSSSYTMLRGMSSGSACREATVSQ